MKAAVLEMIAISEQETGKKPICIVLENTVFMSLCAEGLEPSWHSGTLTLDGVEIMGANTFWWSDR